VSSSVHLDLDLLTAIAKTVERVGTWAGFEWWALPDAVNEFSVAMKKQMDLRNEARNLDVFNRDFHGCDYVRFPKVLKAGRRVLIETLEEGESIKKSFKKDVEERRRLAVPLITVFLRMVFVHNLIHCDLHPGNRLVSKDGTLTILDAGIAASLGEEDRSNLRDLFGAVVMNRGREAGLMIVDRARVEKCKDREAFAKEIEGIVNRFHDLRKSGLTLGGVKIGALLGEVLSACRRHGVMLEPKMANVVLSTIVLEGVGRTMDPDLNLFEAAMPFLTMRK
jgi:aarF domain-containing kinase